MPNYAPRVSLSYADMSGVVQEWSNSCEKMVVYQHDADKEINRVHLHMVMIDCKYKTPEALKRQFHSRVKTDLKGNALWSWEHGKSEPGMSFITYMSKGELASVFVKNILPAEIEELRLQWKQPTPKGNLLTERKESAKTKYDLVQEMLQEVDDDEIVNKCSTRVADYLVSVVLKVLRKNRIVIGRYKVREYRDSLMYYKPNQERMFLNFVNSDFKEDY